MVRCMETLAGSTDEVDKVITSALINCMTLLEMDSERKVGVVNTGDGVIGSWVRNGASTV